MSLHLTEHNAIFFHIPRLGGRWVGCAITLAGVTPVITNHTGGNKNSYHEVGTQEDLTGKFLFTFVRHPVAWYRSYWSCRQEKGWRVDWIDKLRADTFEGFLENILESKQAWASDMFKYYIGNPKVMSYVGLNEDMANDLIKILNILKVDFDEKKILTIPPVNASYLEPTCSKEVIDKIIELEDDVITRYYKGTKFENYIYEFVKEK